MSCGFAHDDGAYVLGALSRPIVQRRARAGLMKAMQQTKQRFEAAPTH